MEEAMTDYLITGDDEQIAALDIQHHAERKGWGRVRPDTQQRIRFRETMREVVVQRRGAFFFAVAHDHEGRAHTAGPVGNRIDGARQVISASQKADRETDIAS
jgi:hypothetical protein